MKKILPLTMVSLLVLYSCSMESNSDYAGYSYNYDSYYDENTGDNYAEIVENPFINTSENPVSTFSIDADGASYSNARRYILDEHISPPADAIRTEEFINYFDINYSYQPSEHPISLNGEVSECPWNLEHKLVRIGIQGKPLDVIPNSNFVFLIDVSGSMGSEDKLELLKSGFKNFVDHMRDEDRVAIVTYAGADKLIINSTPGTEKAKIKKAIDQLGSGGGTAGAAGIKTAYQIAEENFIVGGNNRIILGSDGDFNIGPYSVDDLVALIEEKRESGVYLTALGVGRGNLNDAMMEQLANNGNGTYEYIDNVKQLNKVFLYEASKFYTVAKDVKVQVAFNPNLVQSYRLIGYENRVLENSEFENDSTDAGEIGADQNITALYEIVPQTSELNFRSDPTFTIDFRYKMPDSDSSLPMSLSIVDKWQPFSSASDQMKFVCGVTSLALQLRQSAYKGDATYDKALDWVKSANLPDPYGFIDELETVIEEAKNL